MMTDKRYPILFSLWGVQGVIALIWLFLIPTNASSYSLARIALGGLILLYVIVSLILLKKARFGNRSNLLVSVYLYNPAYILALMALTLPPISIIILRVLGQSDSFKYLAYAERLTPLAFVISISGLEWYLLHTFFNNLCFPSIKQVLKPLSFFLLSFAIVAGTMYITGWGISPTHDGSFGNPPTPLLEWQIALAILLGVVFTLTGSRLHGKRVDDTIFLLVFLVACCIWLTDPLVPASFVTPPRAPNFEPYPYSDALIYSQYSQSALIGDGFLWPNIPTRPLYIALLTWMHALVGQNYYYIIALQTILLAFFPAILYLLGRELGSRALGIMLALLAVLRDITANHTAAFASNISYSKLFFSETPTALLLALFTFLTIRWVKETKPDWYLMMTGGILGAASLIRLQSIILLAPLALITAIVMWKLRRGEWIRGIVLLTLSVILMLVPWLIRNYYASGGLVLDDPFSQSMTLARRWSGDQGNTFIHQQANETLAQYSSRMTSLAIENLKRDPMRILGVTANHFFNNMIASLYVLPVRDQLKSPSDLLWPDHAFWQMGTRKPIFTFFYAILLASGLAFAWRQHRWTGLLPFVFSISYDAWTALFWSSGDRFLIPIDWTWILYDCLGILVILRFALVGLRNTNWNFQATEPDKESSFTFSWRQTLFASVIVLCVGSFLPLTEMVFPQKYPPQTREQLASVLGISLTETDKISYGRAIYPRYYAAGDGEAGSAKVGYGQSEEARLVFFLVGPNPGLVIVSLQNAPDFFPNASNVWVVGDADDGLLRARVVKVEKDGKASVYYAP